MIKRSAQLLHERLSRTPRPLAQAYLSMLSAVSRRLLPRSIARRVHNSICGYGYSWPRMDFAARSVILGEATRVALVPHLGEFDDQALFTSRLEYETEVFAWLEHNAAQTYDLIVEIGANVGIYTVFLDALFRRSPPGGTPRIVSFEPSPEAYRRLVENLRANDARFVAAYHAAVGVASGLQPFFEPQGHLTNGSLLREFSEIFSPSIAENMVVVLAASELDRWLGSSKKALIKIDVEGFEPALLAALKPLIERYRPDLLIEVLPFTLDALNGSAALAGYGRFLVTSRGLEQAPTLFVSEHHRDWLLRWPDS